MATKAKAVDLVPADTKLTTQFKIKRQLRNQVFRIQDNNEYLFTILGDVKIGSPRPEGSNRKKSPDTLQVRDENGAVEASTGKKPEGVIILNAVLKSELEEGFPGGSYKGKTVYIKALGYQNGKGYKSFVVSEAELSD